MIFQVKTSSKTSIYKGFPMASHVWLPPDAQDEHWGSTVTYSAGFGSAEGDPNWGTYESTYVIYVYMEGCLKIW